MEAASDIHILQIFLVSNDKKIDYWKTKEVGNSVLLTLFQFDWDNKQASKQASSKAFKSRKSSSHMYVGLLERRCYLL